MRRDRMSTLTREQQCLILLWMETDQGGSTHLAFLIQSAACHPKLKELKFGLALRQPKVFTWKSKVKESRWSIKKKNQEHHRSPFGNDTGRFYPAKKAEINKCSFYSIYHPSFLILFPGFHFLSLFCEFIWKSRQNRQRGFNGKRKWQF